jgi:osmotically-inducible protein OsmY
MSLHAHTGGPPLTGAPRILPEEERRAMSSSKEDQGNTDLINAVRRALWRSVAIRALNLDQLEIEAHGDTVELRGIIASPSLRYVAEQVTRSVRGVQNVVNLLITDEELERDIARALSSEPELRKRRISVNVTTGVASLYGAVFSEEEAEAYRDIAISVPGVVGVESKLHILRLDQPIVLSWQRSLEGRPARVAIVSEPEAAAERAGESDAPGPTQSTTAAPAEA